MAGVAGVSGVGNGLGEALVTLANVLGVLFRVDLAVELSVSVVVGAELDRVLDVCVVLGVVDVDALVAAVELLAVVIGHVLSLAATDHTGPSAIDPAVTAVVCVDLLQAGDLVQVCLAVLGVGEVRAETVHVHHHSGQGLEALLAVNWSASISPILARFQSVDPCPLEVSSNIVTMKAGGSAGGKCESNGNFLNTLIRLVLNENSSKAILG